jgi:hypothetical protein
VIDAAYAASSRRRFRLRATAANGVRRFLTQTSLGHYRRREKTRNVPS